MVYWVLLIVIVALNRDGHTLLSPASNPLTRGKENAKQFSNLIPVALKYWGVFLKYSYVVS